MTWESIKLRKEMEEKSKIHPRSKNKWEIISEKFVKAQGKTYETKNAVRFNLMKWKYSGEWQWKKKIRKR